MLTRIYLDVDVAMDAGKKIDRAAEGIPAGHLMSTVDGEGAEHATKAFLDRLRTGAESVGTYADAVRVTVHDHADALRRTVKGFTEHDDESADWARSTDALIDGTEGAVTTGERKSAGRIGRLEQGDVKVVQSDGKTATGAAPSAPAAPAPAPAPAAPGPAPRVSDGGY